MVFLHEGLGSVELWRDFPRRVVESNDRFGLVYSRDGNGWSEPVTKARVPSYMHTEAELLGEILTARMSQAPILIGHSDGASIALIYAGNGHLVNGLVLLAPHVFVEEVTIDSIGALAASFPGSEMAEKMAKYHSDPAATFWSWANIWLDPAFRDWNIESSLCTIEAPVLLIQCEEDIFGTTAQLDAIEQQIRGPVERLLVPGASHSPHLQEPELVVDAVTGFVSRLP